MDHASIDRDALLEQYVQGHLPPTVEEALEEHVVDCSACQDDLVAIRGLARGVRRVASEDAARLAVRVGLLTRMRRALSGVGSAVGSGLGAGAGIGRSSRVAWLTAAALVVVVGLVAGYAAWLSAENHELRATVAADEVADDGGRSTPVESAREHGAPTEAGSAGSADVRETDRLAALERTLPAAIGTVVLLSDVRGAEAESGTPVPTVDSGSLDGPFALAVYILDDPRFTSYRMQVIDRGGKVVWQRSGLVPNAFEALMATFPPGFFASGSYRVRVFGLTPAGDAIPLETYPFDVA